MKNAVGEPSRLSRTKRRGREYGPEREVQQYRRDGIDTPAISNKTLSAICDGDW